MIPYGRQSIDEADVASVIDVLHSEWLTQGPGIALFEEAMATFCHSKHAVALSNATAALHVACIALGVGKGDLVWTSPNTFVASANCARYCGADVDFVDIDPVSLNMSVKALEFKLEKAKQQGGLPKVVIPVHFSGLSCEMSEIFELSKQYGFKIIEDASHAVGAEYNGYPVGSCKYSDITVFSFHPVKIITTGEGGMALTNNINLADQMIRLRSHGIAQKPEHLVRPPQGGWEYQQIELGHNYRMTNLQAALGLSQLKKLPEFIAKRRSMAKRYHELLANLPVKRPVLSDESSWHLYPVRFPAEKRKAIFDAFRKIDIWVQIHYIPVHTQPYYANLGFQLGDFPEAERYYNEAISLPLFFDLTIENQDYIIDQLKSFIS